MIPGQLIQKTTGEVGVILDVHDTWVIEQYNTNSRGITRERVNYYCSVLFGDEIQNTKIYYRHNSYQLDSKFYTIDIRPEDVMNYDRYRIKVIQ